MAGVLYTAFDWRWLLVWVYGLFGFTHLLYTFHLRTAVELEAFDCTRLFVTIRVEEPAGVFGRIDRHPLDVPAVDGDAPAVIECPT